MPLRHTADADAAIIAADADYADADVADAAFDAMPALMRRY